MELYIMACIFRFYMLLFLSSNYVMSSFEGFMQERNSFIKRDESMSINSAWTLTHDETIVDSILQHLKSTDSLLDPVPVELNFVTMKPTIDNSELFHLIRSFPKGALLHSHDVSSQDMHFYLDASYLPGCLYFVGDDLDSEYGSMSFIPAANYVPISDIRNSW